ncbi:MAG: fibronectin type III domain-containing protein, partial [Spirochaetota bacterium]
EPGGAADRTGNYTVVSSAPIITEHVRVGGGAGGFDGAGSATLELEPGRDALFFPGTIAGSFSIEFWLFPVTASDGQVLLSWSGVLGEVAAGRPQSVLAEIRGRRVMWVFENLFQGADRSPFTLELEGRDLLVPRRWQHHLLRYRADIGLIEYLVDGRVQDVAHATSTGNEEGDVFIPVIGSRSPRSIRVAPRFDGFIDELRISRRFVEDPNLTPETPAPGHVVLGPLDMGQDGSELHAVTADVHEPGRSDVRLFYRVTSSDLVGRGEWQRFDEAIELMPPAKGRYVWLRLELYPGEPGDPSPQVRRLTVSYTPNEPPPPPRGVEVGSRDGGVSLSWNPVRGDDVQGYRVYYGRRSGEYLGTEANRGPSPIDVGDTTSVTIEGLENGLLYYFAVAAYDESVGSLNYSREVVARPQRMR